MIGKNIKHKHRLAELLRRLVTRRAYKPEMHYMRGQGTKSAEAENPSRRTDNR